MEPTSLAGPPSTTSHLDIIHLSNFDYYILEILFNSYRTLIFNLMRNLYLYNSYIYTYILYTYDCSRKLNITSHRLPCFE